ncbi:MAG: hypothetical protein IPJ13_00140 [Saprospiraceae bacterium]|nr:hypothetical protein [Saprospiraceae bacterium]
MGFLFKANVKDLLEDYALEGGVRIPTSFNGSEYFWYLTIKSRELIKGLPYIENPMNTTTQNEPNQKFSTRSKKTSILGFNNCSIHLIYTGVSGLQTTLRFDKFCS